VDVETIATIASAVGAVILIIYRVAKLFEKPRRRQRLLEDLDILGKTPDTSPQHANVSKHVEDELRGLYDPKVQRAKPRINWGLVVIQGFFVIGLGYLTYYLSAVKFSMWSLLPGFIAIGSIGVLVEELTGRPTIPKTKEPKLSKSS
jgi:hypothetical protein